MKARAKLKGWRLEMRPILSPEGEVLAEGQVVYSLEVPHSDPDLRHYPLIQPFRRGEHSSNHRFHVWGWNGDQGHPTLSPSYLARFHWPGLEGVQVVHLYLRNGRIDLLGDSTVDLLLEAA